ncbi:hypothetical protein G6031_02835 [Dietzia sp. CQ4]|uniref:hypothetical protein n=1 Tax=Dietzia sp. (strain CQ4) TaxID=370437 RepID=UPI0015FB442D|nr:hypothetical protein [Dietzia sp. CQ4]MBB1033324.1 hypothetical protein [Dietzia sp. CQ4]
MQGLRALGIDAVGCTQPDTAAQRFDAQEFAVIAFGRAVPRRQAERLKRAFTERNRDIRFVDAFGPIAVAQVRGALRSQPGAPALLEQVTLSPEGHVTAQVMAACRVSVTVYREPTEQGVSNTQVFDATVGEGPLVVPIARRDLVDAYSLVVLADEDEFHHLPLSP